jgi:glutaredoxin
MLETVRDALYRAMTTPRGDSLAAVRIPKDLARRLNATLGSPLAPKDELAKRAQAEARLADLRARGGGQERTRVEAAPVLVYFERDRNARELTRIEELLASKSIAFKKLDVAGDESTIEFVMLQSKRERDQFPVVFVADRAVGGYEALVRADVSGELAKLVHGA